MIRITNIESQTSDSWAELRSLVHSDDDIFDDFSIWWRYPAAYSEMISGTANAQVAAGLLLAMRLGQDLKVEGKISRCLMDNAQKYMEIVSTWWPELKQIKIIADEVGETFEGGKFAGSFFSGGLDSQYTLLKHQNEISHMIFIRGFDIELDNDMLYESALRGVRNVADALGKKVIQVSTNLIDLSRIVSWDQYHGPALISVALGLGGAFRKIFVPASTYQSNLFPWGSHPRTDPLWSTESIEVIHDGCEANRIEKIQWQIAKSQVALDNLRVCNQQIPSKYNCCVCEKCVRTMLNLRNAGVLEKSKAFGRKLTYSDIRNLDLSGMGGRYCTMENYNALIEANEDPKIIQALKFSMARGWRWKLRHYLRKALKQMKRNIEKHILCKPEFRPEAKPAKFKIHLKKSI